MMVSVSTSVHTIFQNKLMTDYAAGPVFLKFCCNSSVGLLSYYLNKFL